MKAMNILGVFGLVLAMNTPIGAQEAEKGIPGERLDPATFSPGIIETMDAVVERDRAIERPLPPEHRARNGAQGIWKVPGRGATRFPRSGDHYVVNTWGDTRMGIRFPARVDVKGAFFGGYGSPQGRTTAIKAVGYLGREKVQETGWFDQIGTELRWLALDLKSVDRIEILSRPVLLGGGWYAMDDLTYLSGSGDEKVVDFDDLSFDIDLTGTEYAGLVWEMGMGEFKDQGVHAPKIPPDLEAGSRPAGLTPRIQPMNAGTPPELLATFQGVIRGDAGSMSFPPDSMGAVGPNHFVVTVNRNFAVYDRSTGARLVNVLLYSFLPGSNGDPRVLFDQHSRRWIVLATDFNASARYYLAVSLTDDPLKAWFKTDFITAQGSDKGRWPDYPTLGVDENGIYSAAYMVGGNSMTIFAIDKAPLIAKSPQLGTITAWRDLPWEGAIQPAHTYGKGSGEYLVSWYKYWSTLRVRRIDPPLTAPTLSGVGPVTIPSFANPPYVPALGSNVPLDTVDARMMMAVYRDGSLWTCHHVAGGAGAACRWYEIDAASAGLIQTGIVEDPFLNYFFPSIMVNKQGDAVMAFTGSKADQYPACYYTGRLANDPLGEMAPPLMYKEGEGPQNNIDPLGRNRWGDYSYTSLDPVHQKNFWTIQEYGEEESASGSSIWGTYIAALSMREPALFMSLESELPEFQFPGLAPTFRVEIRDGAEALAPGTETVHYRYNAGAFMTAPLIALGNDLFEAVLPVTQPKDKPQFYFSALGSGGTSVSLPQWAPRNVFLFDVNFTYPVFEDDFESDKGWTVQNFDLQDGAWERGVPVGGGDRGDPAKDYDGSGSCYLTDNADGDSDVDGGPTRLTSPLIDLIAGDARVSYARWHYNDGNDDVFTVQISNDDGKNWTTVERVKHREGWNEVFFKVSDFLAPTNQVRVRFDSIDNPSNSITESGLDAFKVRRVILLPQLWADAYSIAASTGGAVNFTLDAGLRQAGRPYLLLGSVSGTEPGITLPGGKTLFLNWDPLTDFIIANLASPVFQNFQGALDGSGCAKATLDTFGPLDPGLVGLTISLAFALGPPPAWDFTSNHIEVDIDP